MGPKIYGWNLFTTQTVESVKMACGDKQEMTMLGGSSAVAKSIEKKTNPDKEINLKKTIINRLSDSLSLSSQGDCSIAHSIVHRDYDQRESSKCSKCLRLQIP